jgi:hypothetical protein
MSSILYYSNFCEHSKKLLQIISKAGAAQEIHFICIDKRVKEQNKTFIVLENGQKIVMPENVNRVPALLLLNKGYEVLYGESILQHLKPKQEIAVKKATENNLEPMAFAFGGGGFGSVTSDQYSFLDMDSDSLAAKGNGGVRQMHNYVDLNYVDSFNTPADDHDYKGSNKLSSELTVEKLQSQRDQDLQKLTGERRGPKI